MMNEKDIHIRSNWLYVEDKTLSTTQSRERLKVSPENVTDILINGRETILNSIEDFYEKTKHAHPDLIVVRPSIFTAHLGSETREKQILSNIGQADGGVIQQRDEFQPHSQLYFDAIKQAGFRPEARRTSGKKEGGIWLLSRRPRLEQVSSDWLNDAYALPSVESEAPLSARRDTLARFQDERAAAIDLRDEHLKSDHATIFERQLIRSQLQVSTILASAALKHIVQIGNPREDLADAYEYAYNDPNISPAIVLAIENSEPF